MPRVNETPVAQAPVLGPGPRACRGQATGSSSAAGLAAGSTAPGPAAGAAAAGIAAVLRRRGRARAAAVAAAIAAAPTQTAGVRPATNDAPLVSPPRAANTAP